MVLPSRGFLGGVAPGDSAWRGYIRDDGSTEPMNRVRCRNEEWELQQILEKNPGLLPGDQIDPEDPRRWLLIKREMAVPDPNTGADRWSIDFFFGDQDAIPTFVECKRFTDTRSRNRSGW